MLKIYISNEILRYMDRPDYTELFNNEELDIHGIYKVSILSVIMTPVFRKVYKFEVNV